MCPEADRPVRVLVVDDHPIWRHGVARDLAEAGFLVGPRVTHEPRSARLRGQWQPAPPFGDAVPPAGKADPVVTHDGPAGHGGTLDFQTVPEARGPAARPEAPGNRDEEEPV